MRFRKSVTICKGVKINFSKSGASCTFGVPGMSVNVGKKGTYLNTGIPGTGLYDRKKIGGGSTVRESITSINNHSSQTINFSFDDDGTVTFYDINGSIITTPSIIRKIKSTPQFKSEQVRIMAERMNNINAETQAFINIHGMSPKVDSMLKFKRTLENLEHKSYKKERFSIQEPTKEEFRILLENEAKQKIKSLAFWTLKKRRQEYLEGNIDNHFNVAYNNWLEVKSSFENEQKHLEATINQKYEEEYKLEKRALELAIKGDLDYIENAIREWMATVSLPVDFDLQFEYSQQSNTIYVDLDLPEIEDLPQEKAVELANGIVKKKSKTQKELKNDYIKCIFGLSIFFASNFYNISPCIESIVISGYTQRRDSKTGDIKDDYVYSIKFKREFFEQNNVASIEPFQYCMEFENRCNLTQSMLLKTIVPFEVE